MKTDQAMKFSSKTISTRHYKFSLTQTLMKNFVKALDHDGNDFQYLRVGVGTG